MAMPRNSKFATGMGRRKGGNPNLLIAKKRRVRHQRQQGKREASHANP